MKLIICFIAFISISEICSSQFFYPLKRDAQEVENRNLIITYPSVNLNAIYSSLKNKVSKEEVFKIAQQKMDKNRELVQNYIPKYLTICNSMEFMYRADVKKIMESRNAENYVVLVIGQSINKKYSAKVTYEFPSYSFTLWLGETKTDKVFEQDLSYSYYSKKEYIFSVSFPNDELNENDIILVCSLYNYHLKKAESDGIEKEDKMYRKTMFIPDYQLNYKVLSDKTLLIDEDICRISEIEVSKYYNYPIKILNKNKISELVNNESDDYANIKILWSDKHSDFVYFIFDSNNTLIGEIGRGGATLSYPHKNSKIYFEITENHLSTINDKIAQLE